MRLLATFAVLASLLAAPPALAQRRGVLDATPAEAGSPVRLAALLGFESVDLATGVSLRADAEFPLQRIAPQVGLSIVGSIGYSHFANDGGVYYYGVDDRWESSLGILKIIPAARFTFGRFARLRPYADAGLGLYHASWSHTWREEIYDPYYGWTWTEREQDDSKVGAVLKFAGGLNFDVAPRFSIGGELGFTPYLGDLADGSGFFAMFAAQFRL